MLEERAPFYYDWVTPLKKDGDKRSCVAFTYMENIVQQSSLVRCYNVKWIENKKGEVTKWDGEPELIADMNLLTRHD